MKHQSTVTLDHLSVPVRRLSAARRFYEAALGAIGMNVNMDMGDAFGMGANGDKIFWLVRDRKAGGGGHVALRVEHREDVDAFHAAALEAGGEDHGAPGLRPDYGPTYYAAFVKDGEGNNIEVVCYEKPPRRSTAPAKQRRANARRPAPKPRFRSGEREPRPWQVELADELPWRGVALQ